MDPNMFPITQDKHIIFVIIATVLFLLQFIRTKRWYQLIMAIAIPASLLIYVQPDNKTMYYGVGILEAVLLLLALILNLIQSAKIAKAEKRAKAEKQAAEEAAKAAGKAEMPSAEENAETEE